MLSWCQHSPQKASPLFERNLLLGSGMGNLNISTELWHQNHGPHVDLLTKETKHYDRGGRRFPASPSSCTARAALDAMCPTHWAAWKLLQVRGHQPWDLSQPLASARATQKAQGIHLCTPATHWLVTVAWLGTGTDSSEPFKSEVLLGSSPTAEAGDVLCWQWQYLVGTTV